MQYIITRRCRNYQVFYRFVLQFSSSASSSGRSAIASLAWPSDILIIFAHDYCSVAFYFFISPETLVKVVQITAIIKSRVKKVIIKTIAEKYTLKKYGFPAL